MTSTQHVRAVLVTPVAGALIEDEHVRTRLPAPARWSQLGDVLMVRGRGASMATATAVSHPGVLVVAVYEGSRCWIRLGPEDAVHELEAEGAGDPEDVWAALASLAHAWLTAGLSASEFGATPLWVLRIQPPGSSRSDCRSRRSAASASSACRDRPTEE